MIIRLIIYGNTLSAMQNNRSSVAKWIERQARGPLSSSPLWWEFESPRDSAKTCEKAAIPKCSQFVKLPIKEHVWTIRICPCNLPDGKRVCNKVNAETVYFPRLICWSRNADIYLPCHLFLHRELIWEEVAPPNKVTRDDKTFDKCRKPFLPFAI